MRFHNSPPVAKSKKLSTKLFGLCSDESIISHWMILNRYSLFCVYLDPMSYTVIYEGKEISLAPREFEVLYLLAQRPNWVIPKKNIYCSVWESNYYDDQIPYKTVEHVVWKIRKKMGHDIIETLINVGYRLKKM